SAGRVGMVLRRRGDARSGGKDDAAARADSAIRLSVFRIEAVVILASESIEAAREKFLRKPRGEIADASFTAALPLGQRRAVRSATVYDTLRVADDPPPGTHESVSEMNANAACRCAPKTSAAPR